MHKKPSFLPCRSGESHETVDTGPDVLPTERDSLALPGRLGHAHSEMASFRMLTNRFAATMQIFIRPNVAGAVVKTPLSFIGSLIN